MDSANEINLNPTELIRTLRAHVRLWVMPALACTALAAAYALIAPCDWRAAQALIIRAEAAGVSDEQIGKFSDLSEMKTLQETILELAKSQGVIQATLRTVGPPTDYGRPGEWPALADIEEFRDHIDMRPPGGAEFGKTEVFYVSVTNTDRTRAGQLVASLCDQIQNRLQALRNERAQGMIAEVERTVAIADADLITSTAQLSAFESEMGADLAELRNLNATIGGQGEVSQEIQAVNAERRANEAKRREQAQLLALLKDAQADATKLIATPTSLLRSQAALSRLKDALVDAQVRKANLLGIRSDNHPFVLAATEAEELLKEQLHDEISVAIQGVDVELALCDGREQSLAAKSAAARERMTHLAGLRAEYANLVTSVENHTKLVESARKHLSDARARQAAALSASVISRIDGVETGVRPVGPGRTAITAAGAVGGLLLGFGLVFLISTPATAHRDTQVPAEINAATNRHSLGDQAEKAQTVEEVLNAATESTGFGLFRGMTLEDAIRKVEGRLHKRNGR